MFGIFVYRLRPASHSVDSKRSQMKPTILKDWTYKMCLKHKIFMKVVHHLSVEKVGT